MNWLKEIEFSSTPALLVAVVNEYLRVKAEDLRYRVPAELNPVELRSEQDLVEWHAKLTAVVTDRPGKASAALLDMSYVFLRAAARLVELQKTAPANGNIDEDAREA